MGSSGQSVMEEVVVVMMMMKDALLERATPFLPFDLAFGPAVRTLRDSRCGCGWTTADRRGRLVDDTRTLQLHTRAPIDRWQLLPARVCA
jgi:hypothetical protein